MKTMMMAIAMVLGFTVSAHAANFAEKTFPAETGFEQGLKELFSQEMQTVGSPLQKYVAAFKAENPDYFVADKIEMEDIFTIESGASGGIFSASYLLVIRAGYRSNSFPMGYLKAYITTDMDDTAPFKVVIKGPAKVTIE